MAWKSLNLVCLASISVHLVSARYPVAGPVIDLGYAKYLGRYNTTLQLNEYHGLPFALPPIGPLRWKSPAPYVPPINSSGAIINATAPGASCVQGSPAWRNGNPGLPSGSEDCLIVDIIQPANAREDSKLPVLVNIHGGGYTLGDAPSSQAYALVHHSKNSFVSVSVQYRLGAYGFLGGSQYAEEGGEPNLGLQDQRLALDWVQNHIAAFGGDPKKVTIVGGSAGGGSVTDQMILYGGSKTPPFRAAMPQFPWWQQFRREEQLSSQFEYLLSAANCSSLACLRDLSEDVLKAATQATYIQGYADGDYGYGNFYYGPYVDGKVIQDLPSTEFRVGHFTKVPILVDRAIYEGLAFTNKSITTKEEQTVDLKRQFPYAGDQFFDEIYLLYASEGTNSTVWQRQAWFGDFIIDCPTYYIASTLASSGERVWKTVQSIGSQVHSAITPYLRDLQYENTTGANITLAYMLRDWYVSFAIHNNPNAESWSGIKKPLWPEYSPENMVLSVNYTEAGAVSDEYFDLDERCQFFWENGEVVQN